MEQGLARGFEDMWWVLVEGVSEAERNFELIRDEEIEERMGTIFLMSMLLRREWLIRVRPYEGTIYLAIYL